MNGDEGKRVNRNGLYIARELRICLSSPWMWPGEEVGKKRQEKGGDYYPVARGKLVVYIE